MFESATQKNNTARNLFLALTLLVAAGIGVIVWYVKNQPIPPPQAKPAATEEVTPSPTATPNPNANKPPKSGTTKSPGKK